MLFVYFVFHLFRVFGYTEVSSSGRIRYRAVLVGPCSGHLLDKNGPITRPYSKGTFRPDNETPVYLVFAYTIVSDI